MATATSPDAPDMLTTALDYLGRGLSVFPVCTPTSAGHCIQHGECSNAGKRPLVRWEAFQARCATAQELAQWWRKWPSANIGMATGQLSGVVVLDADGDEARKVALQRGLEETPIVWTGKPGGGHVWLAWPGQAVKNFARKYADLPGIDFRGDGGYVLLPPSLHASGQRYRWHEKAGIATPLAPVPSWLADRLLGRETATPEPWTAPNGHLDLGAFLRGIPEGSRDDSLFRLAAKCRGDNLPQAYAAWIVQQAARNCQPPFDERDAHEKVARAYAQYAPTPHVDLRTGVLENATAEAQAALPEQWLQPISVLLAKPELPVDWLVDGLFSRGSSGWVGAEPKVGKSFLVLELVYCLATGTPFLGQFAIPRPVRVVYIQEEDPEQRVLRRFNQLIRGTAGRTAPADTHLRYAIRAGFKLDVPAWLVRLRDDLLAEPADICVLDVFQRIHTKSENDQQQMAEVLEGLNALSREFSGLAFLLVHHNRKPQVGNEARANQMLRGSGVLAGWGECSLFLRKSKAGKNRAYVQPESKDAPELEEFLVVLEDTPNGGVRFVLAEQLFDEQLTEGLQKFRDTALALCDAGEDCTAGEVAKLVGCNQSTAHRALEKLVELGALGTVAGIFHNRAAKFYTRSGRITEEPDDE